MNTQQLVDLVTDAVTDAVRDQLPRMVAQLLDSRLAPLDALLVKLQQSLDGVVTEVHERITHLETDFATRATQQADSLVASWRDQVASARASITEQVAQAVAGIPSQPGPAGPPGPPGEPGRDATFISPVRWTADTLFRRGAIVQHGTGVWYANADTKAEPGSAASGYTLLLDGPGPCTFEYDERGFQVVVTKFASGLVTREPTGFRPFQYRGVYDHSTIYHLNDAVTHNGCMWTCRAGDAAGFRPGTDEAARIWQLTVKSGRDGRDGRDGIQGPVGPQGPPGAPPPRAPRGKSNGASA